MEQNKNALKGVEDKRQELELSIEKLDNQIEDFMMKIEENKKGITQTENDINKSKEEIIKVEEEVNIQQDVLDSRVRSMYINGQSNYLKILLESEGFSDLITRIEAITKVISSDKKVISDLALKKAEVEDKKVAIEDKYNEILALKTENENKLASLNNNIADQKKLVKNLKLRNNYLHQR